jgi:HlyD family secretion protein
MGRKKSKKWIIIASVTAVLVVGGSVTTYAAFAKTKAASTTTFRRVTAQTGNINTSVSGSGSVSDSSQLSLTAVNAGTVDSLPVKQGDTVKAGQTIAHISSTASAQAVAQKQNQLTSAQNDLAQAKQQLDSLSIKAPAAGRVKSIIASSGDDLSTIKPLGDLAVLSLSRSMTVSFTPSQTVKSGQAVTVTVSGGTYSGTLSSTPSTAQSSQGGQSGQGGGSSGSTVATIASDIPTVGDTATIKLDGTVIGTGKIQLTKSVSIANSGNGTVSQVDVSENELVNKGQALFVLSSSSVQQQISSKQSAVTSAQNDLNDAKTNAAKDTITSPISGIVAELDVKNGDSVANGGTIAVIIDPTNMQTVVSVDELDISKVQVGQKATVSLSAITDKTFSGSVTQVDPIGSSSNGVATYNVTVTITEPTDVKVGMTTNVNIITESKENTIVVSSGAVLMKSGTKGYVIPAANLFDSNGKSIQLNNTNTASLVRQYGKEVTIGLATTDQDEIVSGISAGDELAIPVTVNAEAVKSLSNQSTSNNAYGSFGGMSGNFGGMGGGSGRRSGGTGNTVAGGSTGNKSGTSAASAAGRSAGNAAG